MLRKFSSKTRLTVLLVVSYIAFSEQLIYALQPLMMSVEQLRNCPYSAAASIWFVGFGLIANTCIRQYEHLPEPQPMR